MWQRTRATHTRPSAPPAAQRTFEIWSFVFKFVLKRLALNMKWTYFGKGGFSEERKKARLVAQAAWLRVGLLRLGPTFIKIGQQARARVRVRAREREREQRSSDGVSAHART